MSRKSAITITVQIRLPVPPGHKPKLLVDELRNILKRDQVFRGFENQITLSVVKRETIYTTTS